MRKIKVLILLVMVALSVGSIDAADGAGRWGVGAFANYNMPALGFSKWYDASSKFGMVFTYVPTPKVTVEVEFHRSELEDGSAATRTFVWEGGDKKDYTSPNAYSDMSFNSLLVNGLIRVGQYGDAFKGSSFAPYIAVGGGFYRYKHNVGGLLWPAQQDALTIELPAFSDQRYALGFNFGFGVEAFVIDNVAIDLRGRYNFVIGQLRPLEDWGLKETFPLQLFDVGAGMKFYFGGQ